MGTEDKKIISEGTSIVLEVKHVIAFLLGLTAVLVTVIGFFYGMLNGNIEQKVDEKIYSIEKKYLDEKDESFSKKLDDISSDVKSTNKSLQTIGFDVAEIKAKQNSSGHRESVNSTPINTIPGGRP